MPNICCSLLLFLATFHFLPSLFVITGFPAKIVHDLFLLFKTTVRGFLLGLSVSFSFLLRLLAGCRITWKSLHESASCQDSWQEAESCILLPAKNPGRKQNHVQSWQEAFYHAQQSLQEERDCRQS